VKDVNDDTIRIVIGAVLIAIGIPTFGLARYFSASEEKKKRIVLGLKIIGILWMLIGVILYIIAFLTH
jgi:hypothetical protein